MARPGGRGGKLPAWGILADPARAGAGLDHQTLWRGGTGSAPERERDTEWDLLARAGDLVRAQWFLWVWATLVGRAIGLLDGITRQLDPEVDALEIVARYTSTP